MSVDVRVVDVSGMFLHSCQLPEVPLVGHRFRLGTKTYKVEAVTWLPVRSFPYQQPGVEIEVLEQ